MEISNDISVSPFFIGPSTVLGRATALRILLCRSINQFRNHLYQLLLDLWLRCRHFVAPFLSWFHPRNPQGILVLVTVVAFILKRYTNVQRKAELAYRRKFWQNMMRSALTYEEWSHAAKMLDKETPKMNESDLYDEELVRNKLQELRQRRQEGSLREIMFCMRADLVRNLGNMCNPELHKGRLHVPRPIKEYIDEVSTQLRLICNSESEDLLLEEKLTFMHETRHAFGRTALLLSGGASLGAFHVGVVKTLVENKLLPRIIAGSSVGSIVCAIVATRSWPDLESFFEGSWHSLKFFDQMGGILTVVRRIFTYGAVHDIRQLQVLLRNLTSNLTFQEAFDMTGRILGVTVCSPRKHEPSRCLNYLTSPHVVIWSAVTASCAFPGLFEAQELMAKDRSGELVPFHSPFLEGPEEGSSSTRRWRDGSLESDLPMIQLKELFNVNHFIVSQANPHIAPLLRLKELVRAYGGSFAGKLAHIAEMEVKHRCNQMLELGLPLGVVMKLFAQEWEGDVTVVMPATLSQYSKIIQNPTHADLQKAANQGRRCTWEKLSTIKANCSIELALDECVALLNHLRRIKRSVERAAASSNIGGPIVRFRASRRIPSWNCIERENSLSSLEDYTTEVSASGNQGDVNNLEQFMDSRPSTNLYDKNYNEPEIADLTSWTRSGGPLMRTASANKFVHFIQSLDAGTELCSSFTKDEGNEHSDSERSSEGMHGHAPENDNIVCASSCIMVEEGDLLQPEKIQNGILLNIVKREGLGMNDQSGRNPHQNSSLECVEIESIGKEVDMSDITYASDNDNDVNDHIGSCRDGPDTYTDTPECMDANVPLAIWKTGQPGDGNE